eukprot:338618_1
MACDSKIIITVISTAICGIYLLITMIIIASFIQFIFMSYESISTNPFDSKITKHTSINYVVMILCSISFVSMVMYISYGLDSNCHTELLTTFFICYGLQFVILNILWVSILKHTLKRTPLELSKNTIIPLFILIGLSFISIIILPFYAPAIMSIFVVGITLSITLTVVMTNKFIMVNTEQQNGKGQFEQELIDIASKIGLLYFISLFVTIISWLIFRVLLNTSVLILCLPLLTNILCSFLCIIFTFNDYNKCYQKSCKCPQKICVAVCKDSADCCCTCRVNYTQGAGHGDTGI